MCSNTYNYGRRVKPNLILKPKVLAHFFVYSINGTVLNLPIKRYITVSHF